MQVISRTLRASALSVSPLFSTRPLLFYYIRCGKNAPWNAAHVTFPRHRTPERALRASAVLVAGRPAAPGQFTSQENCYENVVGRDRAISVRLVLLATMLAVSGCANFRLPAIDPSGDRLFLPNPNYTTLAQDGLLPRLGGGRAAAPGAPATASPFNGPYEPALLNRHRGSLNNGQLGGFLRHTGESLRRWNDNTHRWLAGLHRGRTPYGSRIRTPATLFGDSAYPRTPLPPSCGPDGLAPAGGPCYPVGSPSASSLSATTPRTGGRVDTGLSTNCGAANARASEGRFAQIGPGVILARPRYTARVGDEVVVLGAIAAKSGIARGGEPVKWSLSRDSVGTIVDAARPATAGRRLFGLLRHTTARQADCGDCVQSITSDRCRVVTRSPRDPADDIYLKKGQTWVSVTSGSPGQSFVTLAAPQLGGKRVATAIIDWTDATWDFPRPVLASMDLGQLITRVYRKTDRSPLPNWRVRYRYVDGPAVIFEGNGSSDTIDILTDARGRAILTARPSDSEQGTTRFGIQIFDPKIAASPVHQGMGYITWSDSEPVGGPLVYPEEPTQIGPPDMGDDTGFDSAEPFTQPDPLAGDSTTVTPPITADPPIRSEPEETRLSINVTPPSDAVVGARARYVIEVVNRGDVDATDVTVVAMEPARGLRLIQRSITEPFRKNGRFGWALETLAAGERRVIPVDFEVRGLVVPELEFTADASNASNPVTSDPVRATVIPRNLVRPVISEPNPFAPEVGQGVVYNVAAANLIDRQLPVRLIIQDWSPGLRPITENAAGANAEVSSRNGIQYPPTGQPPIAIAPGDQLQPLPLPFETLQAGSQEFTVIVMVEDPNLPNAEPARERVVLNVRPATSLPPANQRPVRFESPRQIDAGTRGTVRVYVHNVTQVALRNVVLTYRGSRDLYPTADSQTGFRPSPDGLTYEWTLGDMEPGQNLAIEVVVEASNSPRRQAGVNEILVVSDRFQLGNVNSNQPVPEVVRIPIITPRNPRLNRREDDLRVRRTGIEARGPRLQAPQAESNALQTTLEISPREVITGDTFDILVRLNNRNQRSFRNVSVTLNLAPNIQVHDYHGPPTTGASISADGRHLHFGTLREVLPGEQLVMRAQVTAQRSGPTKTVARVEAIGLIQPIIVSSELTVH